MQEAAARATRLRRRARRNREMATGLKVLGFLFCALVVVGFVERWIGSPLMFALFMVAFALACLCAAGIRTGFK